VALVRELKNTPIPYSTARFLEKNSYSFYCTLPFGYSFSLGYVCFPVVNFIFYVLASLELIAEEIEGSFWY
jgi:putative membrane protein